MVFQKSDEKEVWMNVTHYTDFYLLTIIQDIINAKIALGSDYNGPVSFEILSEFLERVHKRKLNKLKIKLNKKKRKKK